MTNLQSNFLMPYNVIVILRKKMIKNKIVWGVIGAGSVCEVKSVPGMYKTEHSEVKTVMRRNLEKAKDFAERHQIQNATNDADTIFSDPEIDIVYVGTPPDSHCEYTLKAAAAGKAVYVEKPMANTVDECLRMIEACEKANVSLFVAYYRRKLPGFLKLKDLIEGGKIGDVRFVNIEMYRAPRSYDLNTENNWRVFPEISGGGHFHDLASHQLDFLDYLFGKITKSKGIATNQAGLYPAEDLVTASFEFESGVVGTGMWCFTANSCSEKETITILGSKGQIVFNTFGSPMLIDIKTAEGTEILEIVQPQHIQQPLIQSIIDELRGSGECPSRGTTAIRTAEVLNNITEEYRNSSSKKK